MKTRIVFAAVLIPLVLSCGCYVRVSSSSQSQSERWNAETNLVLNGAIPTDIRAIEVVNRNGRVRITGTDSQEGRWEQRLTLRARTAADFGAAENAIAGKLTIQDGKARLSVAAAGSRAFGFTSELEISIPKHIAVQVRNEYSAITVSDLNSDLDVIAQSGAVEVRNVKGSVRARNSYASLSVENVGRADLRNTSGRIEAVGVHGSLNAETSYAALTARDVEGSVRLRNQSGRIDAENTGDADIETSYANLSVRNVSGTARLCNSSGRITAESISGELTARTSYAVLDVSSAGPVITCENQSGRIHVRAGSPELKTLSAVTSYASMEIELPENLKPAIEAETSYAKVQSDFPLINSDAGVSSSRDSNAPRIRLRNLSGAIKVLKR